MQVYGVIQKSEVWMASRLGEQRCFAQTVPRKSRAAAWKAHACSKACMGRLHEGRHSVPRVWFMVLGLETLNPRQRAGGGARRDAEDGVRAAGLLVEQRLRRPALRAAAVQQRVDVARVAHDDLLQALQAPLVARARHAARGVVRAQLQRSASS